MSVALDRRTQIDKATKAATWCTSTAYWLFHDVQRDDDAGFCHGLSQIEPNALHRAGNAIAAVRDLLSAEAAEYDDGSVVAPPMPMYGQMEAANWHLVAHRALAELLGLIVRAPGSAAIIYPWFGSDGDPLDQIDEYRPGGSQQATQIALIRRAWYSVRLIVNERYLGNECDMDGEPLIWNKPDVITPEQLERTKARIERESEVAVNRLETEPPSEPPYLGITVSDNSTATREGFAEPAKFGGKQKPWGVFLHTWKAGGSGVEAADLFKELWPKKLFDDNLLSKHKRTANEILEPLKVSIETDGKLLLVAFPGTKQQSVPR